MKGLLLKDFYMIAKYCRSYLLILAAFLLASVFSDDNFFFIFYPCVLAGLIPVTLLSYDERSRWNQYFGTLPYTKSQFVSVKYLISLLIVPVPLVFTAVSQSIRMYSLGTFDLPGLLLLLGQLVILALFPAALALPFIFKFGIEKGRMGYYIMIAVVCAGAFIMPEFAESGVTQALRISPGLLFLLLLAAAIVIYAASWLLSIRFYEKREI